MSATFRLAVVMLWCVACSGSPIFAQSSSEPIVPKGAMLEHLFTRQAKLTGGLTEGAAVAPDGSIYFSDIPIGKDKGMILRYDPRTNQTTVFTDDSRKSNGLMFDAAGRLVSCEGSDDGGRAVTRWDVKTKQREVLADRYMGKKFNAPNDLCIDLKGRIYFTDPRYLGDESRELEHRSVYRIDGDGTVTEVTHEVEKPNGIAISPDQHTLYVGDNNNGTDRIDPNAPPPEKGAMKIYAFALSDHGAVVGPRRIVYDFGREDGCDGMTVDNAGNLYLTSRSAARPGILIINPEGKEQGFVPTGKPSTDGKPPQGLPSNCDFGIGDEKNVLYITVDTSLYRVKLNATGWHLPWKQ